MSYRQPDSHRWWHKRLPTEGIGRNTPLPPELARFLGNDWYEADPVPEEPFAEIDFTTLVLVPTIEGCDTVSGQIAPQRAEVSPYADLIERYTACPNKLEPVAVTPAAGALLVPTVWLGPPPVLRMIDVDGLIRCGGTILY